MFVLMTTFSPKAIFPDSSTLSRCSESLPGLPKEFSLIRLFLLSYTQSADTYNAYRREVERYVQWVWFIKKTSVADITRHEFIEYIKFFQSPPLVWVAPQNYPRFIEDIPNKLWRPFVVPVGKSRTVGPATMKSMLGCLSTMYTFLVHEGYVVQNPIQMIKQKKQLVKHSHGSRIKRRLSPVQWRYVIDVAESEANADIQKERNLYVLSLFYLLGLRISEISQSASDFKSMSLFYRDNNKRWWFEAHGKGNKTRDVAVPDAMMDALARYRMRMGLDATPSPTDFSPLVPKLKGDGGLGQRQIRALVAYSFEKAVLQMVECGLREEAHLLQQATVHWLRHTSISEDVRNRPSEHVRDDVGHNDIATTSLYIDVLDANRHESAKDKQLRPDDY